MPPKNTQGSSKRLYDLNLQIHYIKASLKQLALVKIRAKIGFQKQETQAMQYDSSKSQVIFEYPVTLQDISMKEKSGTFQKKTVFLIVFEIDGKSSKKLGKAKFEFSEIAKSEKPITKLEIPIEKCSDPNAKVCISAELSHNERSTRGFASSDFIVGGISDFDYSSIDRETGSQSLLIHEEVEEDEEIYPSTTHRRSVIVYEKPPNIDDLLGGNAESETVGTSGEPEARSMESDKDSILTKSSTSEMPEIKNVDIPEVPKFIPPIQSPVIDFPEAPEAHEIPEAPKALPAFQRPIIDIPTRRRSTIGRVRQGSDPEAYKEFPFEASSPRNLYMAVAKENAIHPKESKIESESSSEDEEPIFISEEEIVKKIPIKDMGDTKPNEKSKTEEMVAKENQSGLSERTGTCAKCTLL
eukprot:CAMPEP_0202947048 /NCGR_PEP_ID=MMETSP1395-20130829/10513_1 /ASSEMBLY_ACC=CAM_ASM_000871 /TAXON_ID=5961 /ORGANISM="Blepharisma japonicum, Strain Stock R1072" /LENGTH=411 /DNA_ID=CAMNT_0049648037 /DNA_START=46 /DNA_END=1277 /DNA_ORIENTATION=-